MFAIADAFKSLGLPPITIFAKGGALDVSKVALRVGFNMPFEFISSGFSMDYAPLIFFEVVGPTLMNTLRFDKIIIGVKPCESGAYSDCTRAC